jgi:hypothetical protein
MIVTKYSSIDGCDIVAVVTRRGFLQRGILGGLLLASAGGAGLAIWPTRVGGRPRRPLRVLDERQFTVLCAVAARTVQAPGADPVEIAHGADQTLSYASLEAQRDIGKLLLLFENALAGLAFDGRARPFTHLDGDRQDAVLRAWRDSRILVRRSGYQVLRKLTQAAHYASPSTWAAVGYPGPPTIGQPT